MLRSAAATTSAETGQTEDTATDKTSSSDVTDKDAAASEETMET